MKRIGSHPGGPAAEITRWLAGEEFHEIDDAGLVAGLGRRCRAAALPIDRLVLHQRTLHPEILARAVAWAPNEPVKIYDLEHGTETSASFVGSPLYRAMESGELVLVPLQGRVASDGLSSDVLRNGGLTELVITPLRNTEGPPSAMSFGTARPGGFAVRERSILTDIVPALRECYERRISGEGSRSVGGRRHL